jgi:hypothetical protein
MFHANIAVAVASAAWSRPVASGRWRQFQVVPVISSMVIRKVFGFGVASVASGRLIDGPLRLMKPAAHQGTVEDSRSLRGISIGHGRLGATSSAG